MSLVSIPQASKWASDYLEKEVSPTNISYLVQYGKVKKHGNSKMVGSMRRSETAALRKRHTRYCL